MSCPICESLNREHSLLCEEEARLTLVERSKTIGRSAAGESASPPQREQILSARKRQVRIASKLENHKALAHSA